MKKLMMSFAWLLLSSVCAAQNLSGIWKGKMTVDTPRYDINLELALDDDNQGNITGYLTRTVVLNDTFFYSLIKVKGIIKDAQLVIEDAGMVANNFPERRTGIKQTTVFRLDEWHKGSSVNVLTGQWSTNRVKGFMGLSGVVQVERLDSYDNTQIFRRLEDRQLLSKVRFLQSVVQPQPDKQAIAATGRNTTDKQTSNKPQGKVADTQTELSSTTAPNLTAANPQPALKNPVLQVPPSISPTTPADTSAAALQPTLAREKAGKSDSTGISSANPSPLGKTNVSAPGMEKANVATVTTSEPVRQAKNTTDTVATQLAAYKPTPNSAPVAAKPNTAAPGAAPTKQQQAMASKAPAAEKPAPVTQVAPAAADPNAQRVVTTQPQAGNRPLYNPEPAVKPATSTPVAAQPTSTPTIARNETANQPAVKPAKDGMLPATQQETRPVASDEKVAVVQARPLELINTFDVRSDSLVLALYDNGEIDGDTVSVFLNDKLVISKQGLSATAFRKTIYFEPDMRDSIKLVLFAENLGRIPPNTGLLLVYDGDLRYEVYFSANLKSSSAIILRRKRD